MDDIKKINYAELFKENRHVLVKKFISKELSDFLSSIPNGSLVLL